MDMIGNHALSSPWPTFFFTLSAADTVWPDFFRACNPALSWRSAARLRASERRRYLAEYPDIASQHFYRRFKAFFDTVLNGAAKPLGTITDYFWRVEFQKRGSPHIHGLLWIADAPDVMHLSESEEGRVELANFVDRYISASLSSSGEDGHCSCGHHGHDGDADHADILAVRPDVTPSAAKFDCELHQTVQRVQMHRCAEGSSCRAKKGSCRFDFPKDLRTHTSVDAYTATNGALSLKINVKRNSAFTNNYSPELLYLWRANMDIKLVGNAYGAAEYTAAYVSKSEPDSSQFGDAIVKALRKTKPEDEHFSVLKRVANATISVREVSAQETMWILLRGMPMFGKSRNILKVKCSRHDRRYYRVEPKQCRHELGIEDVDSAGLSASQHAEIRVESSERA